MNNIRKRYGAFLFSFISVSLIWGIYNSYNNKVMWRRLHVRELTPGVKSYIHEITKRQTPLETTPSSEKARVLCLILTVENTLQTRAAVVNATWARRYIINTPFEETRNNIIHKVKYSLTYIYEHHIDDFDWILKADDDTYIIMENLQFLLRKQDSKKPQYLGFHFNKFVRNGYMSGGAGYVISNCGLRYLVEFGFYLERCPVVQNEEDPENSEDLEIGRCLSIAKVPIINSIDEEGRETFHPYPLEKHLMGSIPEYVFDWAKHQHKEGMECCSKYSISFHYMEPKTMLLMDHLLYRTSVYGLREKKHAKS